MAPIGQQLDGHRPVTGAGKTPCEGGPHIADVWRMDEEIAPSEGRGVDRFSLKLFGVIGRMFSGYLVRFSGARQFGRRIGAGGIE